MSKAVLYSPNITRGGVGVLIMEIIGQDDPIEMVVDVHRKAGTNSFIYTIEDGVSNGLNRILPEACWKLAADSFSAVLLPVDGKWLSKEFASVLRPYNANKKVLKLERAASDQLAQRQGR